MTYLINFWQKGRHKKCWKEGVVKFKEPTQPQPEGYEGIFDIKAETKREENLEGCGAGIWFYSFWWCFLKKQKQNNTKTRNWLKELLQNGQSIFLGFFIDRQLWS